MNGAAETSPEVHDPTTPTHGSAVGRRFINRTVPYLLGMLAGLLILVLCVWMALGIFHVVMDVAQTFNGDWASSAERVIVKALIILALLEVVRTLQSYLKLGRVRVTFIIDTALVVLISELIGLWFKEYSLEKVLLGTVVIIALVVLRIITARYSPAHGDI
jgi:uncharacterized membrane protein (DUF373 family)